MILINALPSIKATFLAKTSNCSPWHPSHKVRSFMNGPVFNKQLMYAKSFDAFAKSCIRFVLLRYHRHVKDRKKFFHP